jgi:Ca-activated chloride channel family protein
VDSRVVTDGSGPHRVTQPVEPAAGWAMLHQPPAVAPPSAPMMLTAMAGPSGAEAAVASSAQGGGRMRFIARPAVARGGTSLGGILGRAPAQPTAPLGEVRELAALELRRLRAASEAPAYERRQLLDDLATRLAALLRELPTTSGDGGVEPVRQLVEAIHAGREDLDALWTRALRVLAELAGPAGAADTAGPADPAGPAGTASERAQRPFWKR